MAAAKCRHRCDRNDDEVLLLGVFFLTWLVGGILNLQAAFFSKLELARTLTIGKFCSLQLCFWILNELFTRGNAKRIVPEHPSEHPPSEQNGVVTMRKHDNSEDNKTTMETQQTTKIV